MGVIDYRQKYMDLKIKFMDTMDLQFRLGYEQGANDAMVDQANQQAQQMQSQPGQDGQSTFGNQGSPAGTEQMGNPNGEDSAPASSDPGGSELDKHISTLEGMISKGEISQDDLKKAIQDLKFGMEMKKSSVAINNMKRRTIPKLNFGKNANANLNNQTKETATMQHKIVSNILEKWEKEESAATQKINQVLDIEGFIKKSQE